MKILAHRGHWTEPGEKNSLKAIERAFRGGFGIETDVRDHAGALVISHDPPVSGTFLTVAEVLSLYLDCGAPGTLAINIKADGLQDALLGELARFGINDYFVFDMSVPDAVGYLRHEATAFTRQSEHEPVPAFYAAASGVWLDAFEEDWFDNATISGHLAAGKHVALVSPELHGRDHGPAWERWRQLKQADGPGQLFLCTDLPDTAGTFFHE